MCIRDSANRNLPDRRRYLVDDAINSGQIALTTGNDISCEWTQLDEHIVSANVNDKIDLKFGGWKPNFKYGAYGEYRTRKYQAREFIYNWDAANNHLPDGFRQMDVPTLLSNKTYLGDGGLDVLEQVRWRNNYSGHNTLGAGYLTAFLPFGKLSVLDVYKRQVWCCRPKQVVMTTRIDAWNYNKPWISCLTANTISAT